VCTELMVMNKYLKMQLMVILELLGNCHGVQRLQIF